MLGLRRRSESSDLDETCAAFVGGLFLEPAVPASFVACISSGSSSVSFPDLAWRRNFVDLRVCTGFEGCFLSVSLSIKGRDEFVKDFSAGLLGRNEEKGAEEVEAPAEDEQKPSRFRGAGTGAMNTTKHLWAGAVAAMVSRIVSQLLLLLIVLTENI